MKESLISRLLSAGRNFRAPRLSPGLIAAICFVAIAVALVFAAVGPGADGYAVAQPSAGQQTISDGGSIPSSSDAGGRHSERVVVKMTGAAAAPDLRGLGLEEARELGHEGTFVLEAEGRSQADLAQVVDQVRRLPGVVWARTTAPREPCLVPDDTVYGLQWGIPRVQLPEAWDTETGSSEVIVAILDTGIDQYRADFAGRIVFPYSSVSRSTAWPSWRDGHGHGTAVAGVAVAQGDDGQGMAGAAWNVKIMPVKIADDDAVSDDSLLADGIYWAVDHGADIINISFAGSQVTATEADAIQYALDRDLVVVAAAGNEASSFVWYPAALPGVIAVGATAQSPTDSRADFSATGDALDLAAPGQSILSWHVPTSSWKTWNGTSFSSPLVAGIAALVRSAEPGLTGAQVSEALTDSADDVGLPGWDRDFGWGVVDAQAALTEAAEVAEGTTTTTSTSTTTTSTTLVTTTSSTTSTTSTSSTTTTSSTTSTTLPSGGDHFADVSSSPYYEQIERLAALGVVSGKGDGLFYPGDDVLRQQFAKMIVKTLRYPVGLGDLSPFTDVEKKVGELFPYHYVAVAWSRDITQGTDSTHFSPYKSLTRAQLITMVVRAAMLPEPPKEYEPPFGNFSTTHYPYARRAAYAGILDGLVGMGADYPFLGPASREEVCGLLVELLQE